MLQMLKLYLFSMFAILTYTTGCEYLMELYKKEC